MNKNIINNLYVKDYGLRIKECFELADKELINEERNNKKGFRLIKEMFKKSNEKQPYYIKVLEKLQEKMEEKDLTVIGKRQLFIRGNELLLQIPNVGEVIIAKFVVTLTEHGRGYDLNIYFYDADEDEIILDSIERRVGNVISVYRDMLCNKLEEEEKRLSELEEHVYKMNDNLCNFDIKFGFYETEKYENTDVGCNCGECDCGIVKVTPQDINPISADTTKNDSNDISRVSNDDLNKEDK